MNPDRETKDEKESKDPSPSPSSSEGKFIVALLYHLNCDR